ncbi:MAG: exo-alpha-sialidase [Planctomycetes bacterium]|nr:exo-alpha-sialidase [Planctomycetota bacterium]
MAKRVHLLVGTKRGLFIGTSDTKRKKWSFSAPCLGGLPVNIAVADTRNGTTLYAGVNSWHWGPCIQISKDMGKTWKLAKKQPRFPKDAKKPVESIWQIQPDVKGRKGSLYCGVAPAALFHSDDGGATWTELKGLTKHPTRSKWMPGFGGLCLHSILVDPRNEKHLLIAISAVGVFESFDRGASWELRNVGLHSVFNAKEKNSPSSCVHKIAFAGRRPDRIYQQNHVGFYRRDGAHADWKSVEKGLPSRFGFPLVAHPHDPETAYTIPLQSDGFRAPKDGKLAVYTTNNAGASWKPLRKGLPDDSFVGILRDAFATDGLETPGLYFGTTSGQVYASADAGKSWQKATDLLPQVLSVRAFVK